MTFHRQPRHSRIKRESGDEDTASTHKRERKENKRREKKRARGSSVSRFCINPMIDRDDVQTIISTPRAKIVSTIESFENVFRNDGRLVSDEGSKSTANVGRSGGVTS